MIAYAGAVFFDRASRKIDWVTFTCRIGKKQTEDLHMKFFKSIVLRRMHPVIYLAN